MAVTPNEEPKDYWSLRRQPSGAGPPPFRRSNSNSSNSQTPPANNVQSTVASGRYTPLSSPSLGVSGVNTSPSTNNPSRGVSSLAAAAAFQNRRPMLHLVPPNHHADDPRHVNGPAESFPDDIVDSTPTSTRRLWFRKKSGGPATSLIVYPNELVDDVKIRILEKYPTSLQLSCDPADLIMTAQQSSGLRLELQPDENMIAVIDRFHPGGMKMNDAVEVGPSVMWSMYRNSSTSSNGSSIPINATNNVNISLGPNSAGISSGSANTFLQTNMPLPLPAPQSAPRAPRSTLQRARSYSHTQSNTNQLIPMGGQPSPLEEPATSERNSPHSPLSDHNSSVPSPPNAQTQSHTPYSQHPSSHASSLSSSHSNLSAQSAQPATLPLMNSRRTSSSSVNSTSILLLPRHFSDSANAKQNQASRFGMHATKLVPLTSESGKREQTESWIDDTENEAENDEKRSRVSASFLQLQQQLSPVDGKTAIVPQINVLIVEDNPVNQMLLETFMKRRNVRFDSAKNGREALDKWKNGGFHLILMDIQLPVMTGLEATSEIRRLEIINGIGAFPQGVKDHEHPPAEVAPHERISKSKTGFRSPVIIVALTASSDSDDKSEALAAGCNDFLTKPPNFMWLEKKIIDWGCMQALVDYDGWKKWSDESDSQRVQRVETK